MRRIYEDAPWESHRAGELAARADLFDGRAEFYDLARYRGTLILSDIGREPASERAVSYMTDLLDIRYDLNLRTLVTTNLSAAAFEERYGRNCMTRLCDGGWFAERPDMKELIVKPVGTTAQFAAECAAVEAERRARQDAWLAQQREHEVHGSDVTPEHVEEVRARIREGRLWSAVEARRESEWQREPLTYDEQIQRLQGEQ